ncbi:sugar kinase [Palleronia sediminis]|uniref:Sugar kinase n=1 Tax=Palleronia sediminis TaxID=2547833 RepID=A0A4R6A964_9RHOB|nr:sugar kinase [Palleronia sediminis]TDL79425.1 sugar kinase [Palleronia sediminis]
MKKIAVIGEILVEIMADTVGAGFTGLQPLTGPFPSGAPAIFVDQAARLGQPAGIVSAVGDDDFGRVNLDRLARDGVDISAVHVDPDRPTGSAFVRYRADGSRDFVFNIRHSACGQIAMTAGAEALLAGADHLHVMGSSLSSRGLVEMNLAAAEAVKARGGTLSFDPNLRKEMLRAPGMAEAMARFLSLTDLFLPSGAELTLLTEAQETDAAIQELLARGIAAVVHKNGAAGACYHDAARRVPVAGFAVDEVDPTGAGDCFGAAFTTLWLRGAPPDEAMTVAAAAGALAVTARGPMEGACDMGTIRRFIADAERDAR